MKYQVQGAMTISVFVTVEARNAAEARKKAEDCTVQGLCNYCASTSGEEEWHTSGELDGTPIIEKVERLK